MRVTSPLVGRPLSPGERRDWRFILLIAGAALIVIGYALPLVSHRITAAKTTFSGGTVLQNEFPVLVSGQHAAQATHPLNEELKGVEITVEPVVGHGTSTYAWLVYVLSRAPRLVSFWIAWLVPLLGALLGAIFVARAWSSPRGLPEGLIAPLVNVAIAGVLAVVLGWLHTIDFSTYLLSLARQALAPRIGFWVIFLGAAAILLAALALRRETPNRIFSWWALVWIAALTIWLLIRLPPLSLPRDLALYPGWHRRHPADGAQVLWLYPAGQPAGRPGAHLQGRPIYGLASLYVEIIRGIPLLVQLLFIWFALPQVFDVIGEFLISLSPSLAGFGQKLVDLRLQPVYGRGGGVHHLLRRLWLRDLSCGHLLDPSRADGGGALAGHELLPGHALHRAAAGRARHPAAPRQRVRGLAQGFVAGLGAGRLRPDAARARVYGAHVSEL